MGKLFGTDGVRGIVSTELDAELALRIGAATARVLRKKRNHRLKFLIGADTRASKDVLLHALVAGILSEDADVIDAGVIPTPAISHLIKMYNADGGFVISASHNPSEYNGIKVFDEMGRKLPDEVEEEIEKFILESFSLSKDVNKVGTYKYEEKAKEKYVDFLLSTLDVKLDHMWIGVDAANGAAYETVRLLLDKLGFEYMIFNDIPDGYNINDNAGSTHIEGLCEAVKRNNLVCGIAFDGDADRCLFVDENGEVVDGDKIIAIYANYLKEKGQLTNDAVVGTVMSNMGLSEFCRKNDIHFEATKVGDRYVLENMLENGYIIGGEQSGHIIFSEYANTGDGELTALQILKVMSESKKKLSELASIMTKYPQVLENVKVTREGKDKYAIDVDIAAKIASLEKQLGMRGRILVRPSGTENLIRVMVEGQDETEIRECCHSLAQLIKEKYGI